VVMERVAGITLVELNERSKRQGLMPTAIAVHIAARAAAALGYAHRRTGPRGEALRLVHRDVSPANIIVTSTGVVKVLGFALARNRTARTQVGYLKGKLAYMSPERSSGGEQDGSSDVFSLGLVLWELLGGQGVYTDKNEDQIVSLLAGHEKYPALRLRNPGVPRPVELLVEAALSVDRRARPSDGVGFSERLEAWLGQQPGRPGDAELAQYVVDLETAGLEATAEKRLEQFATAKLDFESAQEATVEKRTGVIAPPASQGTPSYRQLPRQKRTHPTLLALAAVVLFAVSVGLGWLTSRVLWSGPEKPAPAAEAPQASPH